MEISEKQWEIVTRRMDDIEHSQLETDNRIDKIAIDIGNIKTNIGLISNRQVKHQVKTESIVKNAVSEATEPLREVAEEIAGKPIKITKDQAENLGMMGKLHKTIRGWK